jgi:hypothetical protein
VSSERIAELSREIEGGEQPEGMEATEMLLLHDPDGERSLAIVFFDNEDDYRKGDEILGSMPTGDTPGRRTSVDKYHVATRMTA